MYLIDELVTLRGIEKEDASVLHEMINDPEMESQVVGWSFPVSMEQQLAWINNLQTDKNIRYAVDAGNGIVGTAIISSIDYKNGTANLNIKIAKDQRGHGYASHAVKLMIGYCFNELNLHCITANVIEDNESSRKLWEKFGFVADGVLRSRVYKMGKYKDIIAYSLLREEYEKRNWK